MAEKDLAGLPEFQRYQYAFSAHLRDPRTAKRPRGVDARRMKIYADLLYSNVERFMLNCFPVLHKVLGKRKWARLVRTFFATHRSHTPYFRQVPDEFIRFLQNEWQPDAAYPDFMLELAHYEWMELVLAVSNREPDWEQINRDGDLLSRIPVINPVLAVLSYAYAVHRIAPRYQPGPEGKLQTQLLLFRDEAGQVRFNVVNPVTARLLVLLQEGQGSGRDMLLRLARELGHPDPEALVNFGAGILADLQAEGAILGTLTGGAGAAQAQTPARDALDTPGPSALESETHPD
jgi:hypothetical protein